MREWSSRAGAKRVISEVWISLVCKLCKCGSAALSLSFLTWYLAPAVRLHLGLELPWLVRGSPVGSSVASFIPSSLPHSPLPGVIATHSPWRTTAAVPGCQAKALGKELCSHVLGSIFRTHNTGLLPVIPERPFIISWEEFLPRKKGKEKKCSGQEGGLDEEVLVLNVLKPETGSFHDAPRND